MKILVDTNVLISAAFRNKLPEQVVMWIATRDECTWLATPAILNEYREVLARPKFGLNDELLAAWERVITSRIVVLERRTRSGLTGRDPKDQPFLLAALSLDADYLITGDNDLLVLRGRLQTRIVTVAEFARQMGIS
jgi:putative PIN family toxin of toxin-antitoxin system